MKVAYFECFTGASGDMLLGAVLDVLGQSLGAWERDSGELSLARLEPWLSQIKALLECEEGGRFQLRRVSREQISALKVDVLVDQVPAEDHHGKFRDFAEITRMLKEEHSSNRFSDSTFELAFRVFDILAQAEAKAHGTIPERVHFHEVGAFDSLMDITGFSAAFTLLGVQKVCASHVTVGSGSVRTSHGILPVPPPAVREILRTFEIPTSNILLPGEFLTPTGAALLASIVDCWGTVPDFDEIFFEGFGAGGREILNMPNAVRLVLGRSGD